MTYFAVDRMITPTASIHACARKMEANNCFLLTDIYKYLLKHQATTIPQEHSLLVVSQKLQQPRRIKSWPPKLDFDVIPLYYETPFSHICDYCFPYTDLLQNIPCGGTEIEVK